MQSLAPSPLEPFLRRLELHSELGDAEREAVLRMPSFIAELAPNQDVIGLGEKVEHCCLLQSGVLARFGQDRSGQRQIASVNLPGDWADLHSVVVPKVGCALQSLTRSTIIKVPHDHVRRAARTNSLLAEAFWRECVIDAAIFQEWMVNVGRRPAVPRLAHLLCEIACRSLDGPLEGELEIEFPVTQQHLAEMVGHTPVHVNRTLKKLREEGLVTFVHGCVTIHDWHRLQQVGEFDPGYLHLESQSCVASAYNLDS